jgi:hypothetical protein
MKLIHHTVNALCETFEKEFLRKVNSEFGQQLTSASYFVELQISKMPNQFKFAFNIIVVAFVAEVLVRRGGLFYKLNNYDRLVIAESWKHSSVSFKRDFIRFFETFVIYDVSSKL